MFKSLIILPLSGRWEMRVFKLLTVLILIFVVNVVFSQTTGKIAGVIKDSRTGETLVGVNVYIQELGLGAATDVDGFYVILNIPPGTHEVRASYVGYGDMVIRDVAVRVDLTTQLDINLNPEILESEEVVVVATRPVIQKDIAGSKQFITAKDIGALPVSSITQAVGLQAGVTSGLSIRGSGSTESMFMVDGIMLRDERNNTPITNIPISAVNEISVQAGGVDAQYHNVRSGVINVVTKEGDANRYSATLTLKASPPQPKYFGSSPYDPNSFFNRPYLDPDVAWTGTNSGAWDSYTQRQYYAFEGWNAFAERTLQDDDPSNDLTPEAAQRLYRWQHRKQGDIKQGDYNIDGGFGGPVPFVSKSLGNLRFYASFRKENNLYLFHLARPGVTDYSYMLKLTSDIKENMKLSILGIYGETYATSADRSGGTSYFTSTYGVASILDRTGFTGNWRLFSDLYFCPTERYTHTISAKLTHVLSSSSFYEVQFKRLGKKYFTAPLRLRDLTPKYEIFDGFFVDEAPIGYREDNDFAIGDNFAMGGSVSTSRDNSRITSNTLKADYINQLNRFNEIKSGIEFTLDNLDMRFGSYNKMLPDGNRLTIIKENPIRLSFYVQDKLEFESFITTLGIIGQYMNPNSKWYDVEPFDENFFSENYKPEFEDQFKTLDAKSRFTLSPRLAISHPISENAKLYFNYGHYQQTQTSERLYRLQRGGGSLAAVEYFGDPSLQLARTVSYELGYDHSLSNMFLFHLAAYYKDISKQENWVLYTSARGTRYYALDNQNYSDIRGFEADLTKRMGKWITGMINYEYRVGTSGYFGLLRQYQNPSEQRDYERRNVYQEKPLPQPRIKSNIDLHTPINFGPKVMGQHVLGDWHFNFLSFWTSGRHFTWNPQGIPGIEYNVQFKDFYDVSLKISKTFPFWSFDIKFFADINNLFNFKYFSGASFADAFDYDYYMKSLHLPEKVADKLGYGNIPGNDQPGDYRKAGVDYVPMEWVADTRNITSWNTRAIYYDASSRNYLKYVDDEWVVQTNAQMKPILDNKAYIDMPNHTYFTFLDPRQIFWGLTISYNF